MIYGSVCSGSEAASVAWKPLCWQCAFVSEIEPFPSAVLKHHYPEVPNFGDFTRIGKGKRQPEPINLLVGGTPCQSFSVAGLRKGLADPRGNLALEYLALADRLRPAWLVWENVPGVLSSGHGRDFGAFLGALEKLGYGFAYRVLDAQHCGVPQRRRRVFVVGYLGDWRPSAAVLFERHSLQGHPAPGRKTGQDAAGTLSARTKGGGGLGTDFECGGGLVTHTHTHTPEIARSLNAHGGRFDGESETFVTHCLRAEGFDAGEDGTGRGTPLVPFAIQERACSEKLEHGPQGKGFRENIAYTLEARNKVQSVAASGVRRLTPRECERLQGFPDDYTLVPFRGKPATDGPRYKALGNSMAVPVMRWIGERIQTVSELLRTL